MAYCMRHKLCPSRLIGGGNLSDSFEWIFFLFILLNTEIFSLYMHLNTHTRTNENKSSHTLPIPTSKLDPKLFCCVRECCAITQEQQRLPRYTIIRCVQLCSATVDASIC